MAIKDFKYLDSFDGRDSLRTADDSGFFPVDVRVKPGGELGTLVHQKNVFHPGTVGSPQDDEQRGGSRRGDQPAGGAVQQQRLVQRPLRPHIDLLHLG